MSVICETGIKIFVILYCGRDSDPLTDLRDLKYMEMASSSRTIKPESLPPTEQAAMFHAYRVHFQLQEWKHSWKVPWTKR